MRKSDIKKALNECQAACKLLPVALQQPERIRREYRAAYNSLAWNMRRYETVTARMYHLTAQLTMPLERYARRRGQYLNKTAEEVARAQVDRHWAWLGVQQHAEMIRTGPGEELAQARNDIGVQMARKVKWGSALAQNVLLYVQVNMKLRDAEPECDFADMCPEHWIWMPDRKEWLSVLEIVDIIFAPKPEKELDTSPRMLHALPYVTGEEGESIEGWATTGKDLHAALKGLPNDQGLAFGDLVVGVDGLRKLASLMSRDTLILIPELEKNRLRIEADRHHTHIKHGAWWNDGPPIQFSFTTA